MHAQAQSVRAQGIVGVHMEHKIEEIEVSTGNDTERTDYAIEYLAWGTAIVQAPAEIQMTRPAMVLDLEDLARTARQTHGFTGSSEGNDSE